MYKTIKLLNKMQIIKAHFLKEHPGTPTATAI